MVKLLLADNRVTLDNSIISTLIGMDSDDLADVILAMGIDKIETVIGAFENYNRAHDIHSEKNYKNPVALLLSAEAPQALKSLQERTLKDEWAIYQISKQNPEVPPEIIQMIARPLPGQQWKNYKNHADQFTALRELACHKLREKETLAQTSNNHRSMRMAGG